MRLRGFLSLAEPMKQDRSEAGKREIKSARTVLIKAMISSFYQYHSGCVFYYRRIDRKAEAGRGGILRSINISATCPAMWRLTFSGGGRSVRLSANGCQPHRPNTALLFCAAGYRPGLLLLSWLFYGNKKHSQNGTGKKLEFSAFYQYRSG